MSLEYRHKGIVVATDHFVGKDKETKLLVEFLSDDEIAKNVTGLWVPKNAIDDDNRAGCISQISRGSRAQYGHERVNQGKTPNFRLIYDTSSSGGVADTLEHLSNVVHHYSAPHMTFTVSLSAFAEVIEATEKFRTYEYEKNGTKVDFLLATAYPENDLSKIKKFTKMGPDEYTAHVSELAHDYELAGVVGAGDLAQYTRVGQYFLALGVCANGAVDYEVETKPWGAMNNKRLVSPEDTYRYATDTEVQLSRTLFDNGDGTFLFPNDDNFNPEKERAILSLVKNNFLSVVQRLDELPEALPLKVAS
jgi:hypothetical protein